MTSDSIRRSGRPRAASAGEVAAVALRLFAEHGYDEVTMTDVAHAARIGRSTLQRYFPSKMAILWSRTEEEQLDLHRLLSERPVDEHPVDALCEVIPEILRYPDDELDLLATQVRLIGNATSGQAATSERFAAWRRTIGDFISARVDRGATYSPLLTETVLSAGWIALTVWADSSDRTPDRLLREAFDTLRTGFVDR